MGITQKITLQKNVWTEVLTSAGGSFFSQSGNIFSYAISTVGVEPTVDGYVSGANKVINWEGGGGLSLWVKSKQDTEMEVTPNG